MTSIRVLVVLLVLGLLAGCVAPEGGSNGGGGTSAAAHKGKTGGVIKVCGKDVTMGELVANPMFRQTLRQYITIQQLFAEADKLGVTVSDEAINTEFEKQKENMTSASGQTWEQVLEMQGMTEDDLRQMIRTKKLFEAVLDSKLDMSDAALKKYWDENKDQVITMHIQMNYLPESERATLTYDKCLDTIKDGIRQRDGFKFQQEVMDSLTLNASLDLSKVLDGEKAKEVEKQILGDEQARIRKQQEDKKAQDAQAPANNALSNPDAGAAAGNAPAAPAEGEAGKAEQKQPEGKQPEGKQPEQKQPAQTK
jgi:hypothetical protein